MKLIAEISLYPLNQQYVEVINDLLRDLRQHDNLQVITNAMSTQISGEDDDVFSAVKSALSRSYERHGKQVLVCKFIPGLDSLDTPSSVPA